MRHMTQNTKKGRARKPAPVSYLHSLPKARKQDVSPEVWATACELAEGRTARLRIAPDGAVVVLNPKA